MISFLLLLAALLVVLLGVSSVRRPVISGGKANCSAVSPTGIACMALVEQAFHAMYQTRALRCRVDTAVRKGKLKVAADQCRFDAAQAAGIIDEEGCAALKEADSLRGNAIAVDEFETLKA